jgi:3-oxoacyl-[acyl-carrier-protein] synthase-3
MTDKVRIAAVAAALPPTVRTSCEVEALVTAANNGFRLRKGLVESMSGVRARRVAAHDVQCSDLAADAARAALSQSGISVDDVDLLIFAAASQDLLEPATANIVQEKLGTSCQVFDVKNACNSFLNGIQIAEAMILSGACETVVVTTGEVCSRAICWRVDEFADFRKNLPGYTMGDAGAAAVLTRSKDARGIFYRKFLTVSRHWDLATIPCGGSMNPRGEKYTYLMVDGPRLKDAFLELGKFFLREIMAEADVTFSDFSRVLVHQATIPYLDEMLEVTGIPSDLIEHTVADFGNMASASLPVAYALAAERGDIRPGDRVLVLGLASGISVGAMMVDV